MLPVWLQCLASKAYFMSIIHFTTLSNIKNGLGYINRGRVSAGAGYHAGPGSEIVPGPGISWSRVSAGAGYQPGPGISRQSAGAG